MQTDDVIALDMWRWRLAPHPVPTIDDPEVVAFALVAHADLRAQRDGQNDADHDHRRDKGRATVADKRKRLAGYGGNAVTQAMFTQA